ncbi:hypothetical protein HPULCUR_009404 [Helicostylum pulchrum]|uniref:Sorting nexin-4 n=1 Tax=Helicostylum pulchrum TaxID=562976 RepID=A0ABP9YAB6_9FUNG
MSEDDVKWDVHAITDAFTPRMEYDDPLQQFSESENYHYSPYSIQANDSTESVVIDTPPIISSPVPELTPRSVVSTPSPVTTPDIRSSTVEILPMTAVISDPQKHQDGNQGVYITYLIKTTTSVETFNSVKPKPVRRRYQDFVWLHSALSLEFTACIVPPLPEKHRLEYIKGDRFSSEFILRRQISLQWFLDRISRHPLLQKSQSTRIFLESSDFKNDHISQTRHIPPSASLFDTIGDTLVNAFAKIKKPDEKFEEMKESIIKLEDNLNIVERLYMRINKRQQDLQNDYSNFAASIQGLSALESNITNSLHQFAETCKAYSSAMKEMTSIEEIQFLNEIHELLAYCNAAKDVLRARDQKQLDFEELSGYLHQAIQERERTLHPGRSYNRNGGLNITDYVTDKYNDFRGISVETAKREKLSKLQARITELQDEVTRTNDESNGFSIQVMKEFDVFQKTKILELKQGLLAYADCHIAFFQKGTEIWEKVLPVLESIDGVKGDGPVHV